MAPSTPTPRPRRKQTVVVIGGGIAGLVAAWELSGGARGPDDATPNVCVLEASDRVGGKLITAEFEGRRIDTGPDSMLGRRPEAIALCRELGLEGALLPVGAQGAGVWARGRVRALPEGLALGIPTRFWPVARSGILGPRGSFRLWLDVALPRTDSRTPLGDRAVGPLIARKLGRRVVDALVDPMLGGINAGHVSDMSTAAAFPLLLAVAQTRGGFMKALRKAMANGAPLGAGPLRDDDASDVTADDPLDSLPQLDEIENEGAEHGDDSEADSPPDQHTVKAKRAKGKKGTSAASRAEPVFWSLEGGMATLVNRLAEKLEARGVTVRTRTEVELLDLHVSLSGEPWVLHTAEGPVLADGVVLAVPAPAASRLLEAHDTDAATLLAGIDHGSVALVTLSYPAHAVAMPLRGTGFLVPARSRVTTNLDSATDENGTADRTLLMTACTFLSNKWPQLARDDEVLFRVSVGRYGDERFVTMDDEALTARVVRELGVVLGVDGEPTSSLVTRWPDGFPQYKVHHLLRVTGIESAVKRLPAIAVAGAAYRGVGIPACIASGRAAAREVRTALSGAFTR